MSKLWDSYGRVIVTVFIYVSLLPAVYLFRNRTYEKLRFCRKKRPDFEKEYGVHTTWQKQSNVLNALNIHANCNYSGVLILKY